MPGYLNSPNQSQPYRSDNTFEGVQMDTPPDKTAANVLTSLGNMHLLRQQGSEIILQTEPGMARAFSLPPNHWIHGWAERAGVLYLLLCEVDAQGNATGGGQLGSWPSPNYQYQTAAADSELVETGNLTPVYRPLHVYYGDNNAQKPRPFASASTGAGGGLNLALDAPSELELQDSYDGTLNIIVNDRGRNPALLVNSGFAVLPSAQGTTDDYGTYRIIVREGNASTNRYRKADFTSRLRLHPKSGTIAKAYVTDVADGGKLPGGEYRYYFCYADADGNETSVFAEAGPVPVFDFANPADAHGARPGETTTRRVLLELSQLDPTFGFVRVRYVRRSGEPSAVGQGYALTQLLTVSPTGTATFSHTGLENETGVNAEQLQALAGTIGTFATMCQAGNRLLLADIRQDAVDDTALHNFALGLQLGHEQVALPNVPGLDSGGAASGTPGLYAPLRTSTLSDGTTGLSAHTNSRTVWNQGGHLNPLNATYRRGYPSGEALAFGVRFVLDDYSLSEVYPLTGGDNLLGGLRYDNLDPSGVFPAVFAADGWSQAFGFGTYNRRGVYRFPETNAPGMQPLVLENQNLVNVLAARITLGGGSIPAAVRAKAVGLQFMRAARTPNRLVQGYTVPTLRSLVTPSNNAPYDYFASAARAMIEGQAGNMKVLPTLNGTLEAAGREYGGGKDQLGVFPFQFARVLFYGSTGWPLHDLNRYALYAPDAILRPATWLAKLNQSGIQVRKMATVQAKKAVLYTNGNANVTSWSLFKTTGHAAEPASSNFGGQAYWTLDKQFVINGGQFGSAEKFLLGNHHQNAGKNQGYLINLAWAPYVGLKFDNNTFDAGKKLIETAYSTGSGFEKWSRNQTQDPALTVAYLVNVYDGGGVLSTDSLKQVYQPESLTYVPITQRLSWQEWESQLDANGSFLVYGGDTYVAPVYHRVTRKLTAGERVEEKFDSPVGQVLSLVCETEAYPYGRADEPASTGETSGASFVPRIGAGTQKFDDYRAPERATQADSTRFNGGYAAESTGSPALVQAVARLENVPFRARQFAARVWASAPAVDGSFVNGYRFLPPLGFRDYERSLGGITRLITAGDQQVLAVHAHGLEVLTINERVLTGEGAGPVYAQGLNFLPPTGKIISRQLGAQHPDAVCLGAAGVYGIDAAQGVLWFWAFGAGEPTRLSDFSVSTRLRPALLGYKSGTVVLGTRDVRLTYDSARGDVVVSLYRRASASGDFEHAANLVYNEPLKQWMGRHDYYRAQALVNVPLRGLFSLPLQGQAATTAGSYSVWQHRALPVSGADAQRAGSYGKPQAAWAEFVVLGSGVDTTKILDNLVLVSEGRDPDAVVISTAEQPVSQDQALIGAPADITRRNAQRREGHTWVTVKNRQKAKYRGRWIRIRLIWSPNATTPNATLNTQPQDAGRLLKVSSIVRDSFT